MKGRPIKSYRPLPVRRVEQIHKTPRDYDRRDNRRAVEEALAEEENMDREKEVLEKIYDLVNDGTHAVRTNGNTLEVYGITQEVVKITVEVIDVLPEEG